VVSRETEGVALVLASGYDVFSLVDLVINSMAKQGPEAHFEKRRPGFKPFISDLATSATLAISLLKSGALS
jgi:hypothetical protein